MIKNCNLNLDYTPFVTADYTVHEGSCIKHQVYELADIHKSFGGFPSTYSAHNTTIHQLWWSEDQIDFDYIGKQLGIKVITISTIKQPPGNIIPIHKDTFFQIKNKYPDRAELRVRANIYMEDWKVGHILQYQDQEKNWHTSDHWKAGQGFIWDDVPLHLSCNAGFHDKYTMQISGFLNET